MYILSQISVAIGMIIDLSGKLMKSKRLLLLFMAIASIFYCISYVLLSSYLPAIMQILLLARALWYMVLDEREFPIKNYFIPFSLINSLFVVALIFFWENIMTLVLVFAMFILTFCLIFKNLVFIKISLIINSILWCTYNFTIRGYVNMSVDLISIVLLLISLFIYDILPSIRKKKSFENNYDIKKIIKICKNN